MITPPLKKEEGGKTNHRKKTKLSKSNQIESQDSFPINKEKLQIKLIMNRRLDGGNAHEPMLPA